LRVNWESKNTAESSATKTQQQIEELEQQLKNLQTESTLEKIDFGKAFTESKSHLIAIGAVASLGIGVASGSDQNSQAAAPLFYMLGIGGGIAALVRANQFAEEKNLQVDQQNKKIGGIRQQLGDARKKYSEYARQIRTNPADLPNVTIGSALIPLESKNILGNNFIIDPTGLIKPSKLKAIALRDLSGDADRILEMTRRLENIPVLLKPDQDSLAESRKTGNTLHGEER
jgi:hypothetical protein